MKKLNKLLFAFLLLISYNLVAQNNLEVDKRNGFKNLKLGTSYDDFTGYTVVPSKNPKKIVIIFKTDDPSTGFLCDYKVDYFELVFDRTTKELENIQAQVLIKKIYSDPLVFNTYEIIADRLTSVLGTPTQIFKKSIGMCWVGQKIFMSITINPQNLSLDKDDNIVGSTLVTFMVDSSIIKSKLDSKDAF